MEKSTAPWRKALENLVQGNERFSSGARSTNTELGHVKLKQLAESGQKPFAVILSCSDSRVPAELLFDCGFGDLFVVRVAGNVVQPSQIASIEYGAQVLGSTLCVIMGHSRCGAVQATVEALTGKKADLGPNIDFLIDLIRPAVQRCLPAPDNGPAFVDRCVRENVRETAKEVRAKSALIRKLEAEDKFRVVEAVFRLETGKVEFQSKF